MSWMPSASLYLSSCCCIIQVPIHDYSYLPPPAHANASHIETFAECRVQGAEKGFEGYVPLKLEGKIASARTVAEASDVECRSTAARHVRVVSSCLFDEVVKLAKKIRASRVEVAVAAQTQICQD
jgi:hypothetical protein